jgi:methylenetetrahydrofolate reductase (NADPH)
MARIADLLAAGPTFSFEFMPPKTDNARMSLGRTISELEPLKPSFVSVTYGAGGSTREHTHQVVTWVRAETAITPMAHLTCVSHTRAEITAILEGYSAAGVENILALGGDPPKDGSLAPSEFTYASELLDHVAANGRFSVGVAAHPEGHPRSADRASDRGRLAEKLARADFAITQFFFDADHYFAMLDDLDALGVHKPVIPGIMPVTNLAQVKRMTELSGAAFPQWLSERLTPHADDLDAVAKVGIEAATELCVELLARGVPGLHFYTMNRSGATREIWSNLNLSNRAR